jgi:histidyl-tRNA synthetase
MFAAKEVPAVGVSIGIERVFAIMEAHERAAAAQVIGVVERGREVVRVCERLPAWRRTSERQRRR